MYRMYKRACLSLLIVGMAVAPALAQNRFMDEAREREARRAENAAVRAAENPEPVKPAATQQPPSTPQPAAAQPAPAETPTTPAQQPAAAPAQ
jgi:hypothetical protein